MYNDYMTSVRLLNEGGRNDERRIGTSLTFSEDMYSMLFVNCIKSEYIYYHE